MPGRSASPSNDPHCTCDDLTRATIGHDADCVFSDCTCDAEGNGNDEHADDCPLAEVR